MHGYCGKILFIDLSTGQTSIQPLDPAAARPYIGASGMAARMFFDLTRGQGQPDPLAPDNPLIFMTGPLQGTTLPGSGRFAVAARSPLTSLWGESNCGGDAGPFLKFAGFDGVVVTGQASQPLTLWIHDGQVELRPAGDLWGKDAYETCERLWASGGKGSKVLCIGPAGERLVRYASIVCDKGDVAGRCGMGAVMGAKRLKAVVIRGSSRPAIADTPAYQAVRRDVHAKIRETVTLQGFKSFGTAGGLYYSSMIGDLAAKNWRLGAYDDDTILNLDGTTMADTILTDSGACYACPVACKRKVSVPDGPFAVAHGPGPEYETIAALGLLTLNGSLPAVAKANELCNRYGMDTISCGAAIAFAMEASERGLLPQPLSWGNSQGVVDMVAAIGERRAVGELLGEGVKRAAAALGIDPNADWVPHVKGSEIPMHDPRAFHGIALGYATTPRGANHNGACVYVEMGSVIYPELGLNGDLNERSSDGKAYLSAMSQYVGGILDALTLCFFDGWAYTLADMTRALNSVAGFNMDVPEMMRCGERIWALKRSINALLGATADDDRLPRRLLTAHGEGPTAGQAPDLPAMLRDFYALCRLDEQGRPTADHLRALGLADVAAALPGA